MKHALSMLALVVLVVGCKPSLNDGQYACPDGNCPSPLLCWSSDHFCHYGADPGGGNDAGPMGDAGALCGGACPAMQDCLIGAWSMPTPSLQCANVTAIMTSNHGAPCTMGGVPVCMSPDACIPIGGGHCLRPCGMPTDPCGADEHCSPTHHVCVRSCPCLGSFTCQSGECLP